MKWLLEKALKKVAAHLALLVVSYAASLPLDQFGITLDEKALTLGIYGTLELLRNKLKVEGKLPKWIAWAF